jgi:uncharacterized protein YegP (UPF0339 family)
VHTVRPLGEPVRSAPRSEPAQDKEGDKMRFKLQRSQDSSQPYYFEIQAAGNYETLATSETYVSKADAQHAIDLIVAGAATATVVDLT